MTTLDRTAGITWADLLEQLVVEHGTLAQVAWKLVEHSKPELDVASVERALRRLRTRGQRDGGAWGQRLVRVLGMPTTIEDRVRWLGCYHSPFNDLPVELCLDQLRLWDRPPFNTSRARLWVQIGFATCATRTRRLDDARSHAARASEALTTLGPAYDTARVELALLDAFLASHSTASDRDARVEQLLDRALGLIGDTIAPTDRACFAARVVDQRAYQRNRRGEHAQALALYDALPREDVHPFASYRRDAGRAYGLHKLGHTAEAIELARRAIEHAGDGGYTRMRAMGLLMLARVAGDVTAIERARAIATRLGDAELLARAAKLS